MSKVLFGIDRFIDANRFEKARFGLVTNDVATNSAGVKSRVALLEAGVQIVKLFSPEHGLSSKAPDGATVAHETDALTHLPVVSLYGDRLIPTAEDLGDIDAVIFDIPDVGCRFYTYLWTMTYVMEACAASGKKFVVLDRPNPVGGDLEWAEGPLLDADCTSFLGRWSIPVRHSCTLGELANYFADRYIPDLDLTVLPLRHWSRDDFPGSKWDFVPTSPAIRDAETALLYPGTGLLEGVNVNEGRGTPLDFKWLGAPWLQGSALIERLEKLNLPGVGFSPVTYTPEWGMYAGETCAGIAVRVADRKAIRPVSIGVALLEELIRHYPEDCKGRLYKTNANPAGEGHLDKLLGVRNSFKRKKDGQLIQTSLSEERWADVIEPYLLYT